MAKANGHKKPKSYALVTIKWHDHCSSEDWLHEEEFKDALNDTLIISAGYLIHEDRTSYTLIQNIDTGPEGRMSMATKILKSTVVSKREIAGCAAVLKH